MSYTSLRRTWFKCSGETNRLYRSGSSHGLTRSNRPMPRRNLDSATQRYLPHIILKNFGPFEIRIGARCICVNSHSKIFNNTMVGSCTHWAIDRGTSNSGTPRCNFIASGIMQKEPFLPAGCYQQYRYTELLRFAIRGILKYWSTVTEIRICFIPGFVTRNNSKDYYYDCDKDAWYIFLFFIITLFN